MGDFRLGSILGFEIRIDYSWFIIFFLVLISFTIAIFPQTVPGLSQTAYIVMGAAMTLLFFASLLAHELSHSIVARLKGIPVEGITLFIFGGVSRTRMEAETPADEFQIAGVGPLSSVLIGVLFGAVWWVGVQAAWPVSVVAVAQYLAFLNVLLAVFNLLPGFPLDGGRLFRAAIWRFTGDLTRATRVASTGGKWLGWAIVALGIWQTFQFNLVGGLWLVFIGWFLRNAAEAGYQQHMVRLVMEGVTARQAMTPDPATVPADLTVQELVDDYFMQRRYHSYPVMEDGRPVGLVTLGQVKEVPREEWPRRRIRDAMLAAGDEIVAAPEENMSRVLEKMESTEARRVLVVDRDGRLAGLITANDVADWLQRFRQLRGE
ncbi:MAG: CBS domain-containing protein [Gemmatimonadota bacterium]